MEIRYVTLNAICRCVPRAGEQVSGGGALCETRLEHRSELPKAPAGGGKVLDLEEYRRRLAEERGGEEEPAAAPEEERPARMSRRERLGLVLDGLATAALIALAGGLLLAVWSWM